MLDDSVDVTYPGQWGMWFLFVIIIHIMIVIGLWAFLRHDLSAFIAVGIGLAVIWVWEFMDKWLLKNYGRTKLERRSK